MSDRSELHALISSAYEDNFPGWIPSLEAADRILKAGYVKVES